MKVYEFCSFIERASDQQEKKKKWGAEENRGSTLFIKCYQYLRHKAEIPEPSNS